MIRQRPARRLLNRLAGVGGLALTAALAAFHGGLLWRRVSDGSLLEPRVALRWTAAALLVAALLRLWRLGLPLVRGRRAAVLWLVVLLLHVGAPGSPPAVAPVASLVLLTAALATIAVLAAARHAPRRAEADPRAAARRRQRTDRRPAGWSPALFSRPPPVSLRP